MKENFEAAPPPQEGRKKSIVDIILNKRDNAFDNIEKYDDPETIKNFFRECVEEIIKHKDNLIENPKKWVWDVIDLKLKNRKRINKLWEETIAEEIRENKIPRSKK